MFAPRLVRYLGRHAFILSPGGIHSDSRRVGSKYGLSWPMGNNTWYFGHVPDLISRSYQLAFCSLQPRHIHRCFIHLAGHFVERAAWRPDFCLAFPLLFFIFLFVDFMSLLVLSFFLPLTRRTNEVDSSIFVLCLSCMLRRSWPSLCG